MTLAENGPFLSSFPSVQRRGNPRLPPFTYLVSPLSDLTTSTPPLPWVPFPGLCSFPGLQAPPTPSQAHPDTPSPQGQGQAQGRDQWSPWEQVLELRWIGLCQRKRKMLPGAVVSAEQRQRLE